MIRLENVTRRYPGADRPALDGVSLVFEQGEFVFVTGPSGAGKSTLLKMLYAAERPDQGMADAWAADPVNRNLTLAMALVLPNDAEVLSPGCQFRITSSSLKYPARSM